MNGFAFLLMLGVFAALAWWYVLNIELGRNGGAGLLGLRSDDEHDPKTDEKPLSLVERRALRKQENAAEKTPLPQDRPQDRQA